MFVFSPAGLIIVCALNAPVSMHDLTVSEWGGLYEKLENGYNLHSGRCVVDSAFSRGHYPFLITSAQDETRPESAEELIQIRQAAAARQASEWGMRAFQGTFPRMKDRFVYEENGEQRLVLLCTVHLFNLRTRLVGINQILTTYMPHLSSEANLFIRQMANSN